MLKKILLIGLGLAFSSQFISSSDAAPKLATSVPFPSNIVCAGSGIGEGCPTSGASSTTATTKQMTSPSSAMKALQSSPTTASTNPCVTNQTRSDTSQYLTRKLHHKFGKNGQNGIINSIISNLMNLIIQLLQQILRILSGGTINFPTLNTTGSSTGSGIDNGNNTSSPSSGISGIGSQNPCPSEAATQTPPGNYAGNPESGQIQPTLTVSPIPGNPGSPSPTATSVSGCEPSGQAVPSNNVTGWKLLFADDFCTNVPLGAFSNCSSNQTPSGARCTGLQPYGTYYSNWWAYPNGWPDTAKSGADGNTGAPYGGVYSPQDTVSVSNGAMHIRMFRPSTGGDNHVATVVPVPCMAHQYGRYTERFKVVQYQPGFKSAHLFYQGGFEIDYPENDYGNTIYAYTHPGGASFSSGAKWTDAWHTSTIEWTAGQIKFYMDNKLIGTTTAQIPNIPMDWILQNESSILGPYAANGASAQLDVDWVACYSQG